MCYNVSPDSRSVNLKNTRGNIQAWYCQIYNIFLILLPLLLLSKHEIISSSQHIEDIALSSKSESFTSSPLHSALSFATSKDIYFRKFIKAEIHFLPFFIDFFYLFLYIVQIFQIVKWMFGLKYFVEYLCIFFLQKLGGGEGVWEVFWCVAQLCCAEQKRSAWKPCMEQISSIFFTLSIIKKVFDQVVKAIFNWSSTNSSQSVFLRIKLLLICS